MSNSPFYACQKSGKLCNMSTFAIHINVFKMNLREYSTFRDDYATFVHE
eukprot:UN09385